MRALDVLAVPVVAVLGLAAAATAQELDAWLPADTAAYAGCDNVPGLRRRFDSGAGARLARDPFLRGLVEQWIARARRGSDAEGAVWPGLFLEEAAGQAVLALVPLGLDDRPVLLVEIDGEAAARRLDARIRRSYPAARRTTIDCRGSRIVVYAPPGGETTAPPTCFVRDGNVLAVAWEPLVLRRLLDARHGVGAKTLAEHGPFRALRRRVGPEPHLLVYLARTALRALSDWDERGASFLRRAGLAGITSLGYGARLEEDRVVGRLFLHAPGEKRGLLGFFDADNTRVLPPAFLPADTRTACTVRLDLRELAGELRRVVRETAPARADPFPLDFEAAVQSTGGAAALQFVKSLGDEYSTIALGPGDSAVLALEVADRRRMRKVLSALEGGLTVRGGDVYVGPDRSGLALVDGHLVAGRRLRDIHTLAAPDRGGRPALRDDATFREIERALPSRRILLLYARHDPAPARHDLWSAYLRAQGAAVVNDPEGVVVHHVALLR